jgi:hypothetical protein
MVKLIGHMALAAVRGRVYSPRDTGSVNFEEDL